MRILVTGATGFIGRRLVERLTQAGHAVVAVVRPSSTALPSGAASLTTVRAELSDAPALRKACDGCDAVVHLAAATGIADPDVAFAVNVKGTRTLLEASRDARAGRFIFISTISALREKMGPYGRTKQQAEAEVRASGVPFVVLRPSLVYGDGSVGLFANLARSMRSLPVVPVIGNGAIELDPIHVDDVCAIIEQCATRDDVLGKSYDLLGPDRVTFNEFLKLLAREIKVQKPFVHVPAWFALLAARALGAISKRPPLSVDNVLGLTSPARVDRTAAKRDFPMQWTPLSAGLKAVAQA
jgi:nucleoside-diphosphate-sugar epimerase